MVRMVLIRMMIPPISLTVTFSSISPTILLIATMLQPSHNNLLMMRRWRRTKRRRWRRTPMIDRPWVGTVGTCLLTVPAGSASACTSMSFQAKIMIIYMYMTYCHDCLYDQVPGSWSYVRPTVMILLGYLITLCIGHFSVHKHKKILFWRGYHWTKGVPRLALLQPIIWEQRCVKESKRYTIIHAATRHSWSLPSLLSITSHHFPCCTI